MGSEERAENLDNPQGAAPQKSEEELFGVIADVERQLANLKSHRAEREEFRNRLESRERELEQRVKDFGAKEAALQELVAAEQERNAVRTREVEEAEAELARRREKLEKDFAALAEEQRRASEAAAKQVAEVKAASVALEQRENRLAEHAASISRQRETFQATAAELAKREEAAAAAAVELEKARKTAHELKARLDESERDAASRASELEQTTRRAMELDRRCGELTQKVDESRKQFEEQSARLAEQLRVAKDEVKRAGDAQSALMAEIAKHDKAAEEARKEAETIKAEAGRRQATLMEAEARVADFKRQVIDRDSRIQDLSSKLAAATNKFREVSQSLQEQSSLAEQAQNLAEEVKDRDRKIAELKAAAVKTDSGAAKADLEALEQQLQQMREQLQESKNACRALKAQLAEGGGNASGAIPEDVGEAVMTRWRRLRIMRSLLQEQGEKLRSAGEAIRERYAQVEQLLAQRDQLAQARAAIGTARERLERLQSRAAVGKVAVGIFYLVGAIAALAGLSWVAAGQVAPATYVARAIVNADTKGQQVGDDQLAEWKKYLDSQLKDPRMMELAADRMGRAGIISLATPGQISQRIETDLVSDSAVPGSVKYELRGSGKGATVRELDTFMTALVSQANATKERRTDGLGVLIAEKPNADNGPVESARGLYSAIIFGAGMCLCLGFGSFTYNKLSKAKVRIEEEQRIDEILEDANWREAEKKLRERRG